MKTYRLIFCPICGRRLNVEVVGPFPETHKIPNHTPLFEVNLCQGADVTVTLDFSKCVKCGCNTMKNSTGLCRKCFGEEEDANRPAKAGEQVAAGRGRGDE